MRDEDTTTRGKPSSEETVRVPSDDHSSAKSPAGPGDLFPHDETVDARRCQVAEEQLWSWIDRDARELDTHLAKCSECRERAERIRSQIQHVADGSWKRITEEGPQPERIGSYRIVREISRGGMGIVYLGVHEDDRFKRHVAVKVLKRGMDTDDVLRRFELERQLLAAMNHPGIARLYDGGETDDGRPYFVLEYVEGMDVQAYCDRHRLRIPERLDLFRKICSAVHYAHRNLVVHRDLKPSNILVTADGEPKLLDFGIAKLINPEMSIVVGDPTAPEFRVMTPEYASPEQVRGDPITTASDVYSLGVLLYELLSGHRPYRLKSRVRAELERVICEQEPDRPSTAISRVEEEIERDLKTGTTTSRRITPDSVSRSRELKPERLRKRLEGDIDNIVLMAMRKEPRRRYTSAEQLAEDIARHLKGEPVIARKDTFGYRASKFVRRNRVGVGAAAVIALTLVGGIVGTSMGWSRADAATVRAEDAEAVALTAQQTAESERDEAEAQRERAEQATALAKSNLDNGMALANVFIDRLAKEFEQIEGGLEAREILVDSAVDYLTQLEEQPIDEELLLARLGKGYLSLGQILGGSRNPNFGKTDQALALFQTALEKRQNRLALKPGDPSRLAAVASVHLEIGELLIRTGRTADGLAEFERAEGFVRDVAARHRTPAIRRRLAFVTKQVGDALLDLGHAEEGYARYLVSEAIRLELARVQYDDGDDRRRAQRDVGVINLAIGGVLSTRGEHELALDRCQSNLQIRLALLKERPESARYRRDVQIARLFVGQEHLKLGQIEQARGQFDQALSVARQRRIAEPNDTRPINDEAMLHEMLGSMYAETNDWSDSLAHYEQFRDGVAILVRDNANQTLNQLSLARAQHGIAIAHTELGNPRRAIEAAREAHAISRRVVELDRADSDARFVFARTLHTLGTTLQGADRDRDARGYLEEARTELTRLRDQQPKNVDIRTQLDATTAALDALGRNRR